MGFGPTCSNLKITRATFQLDWGQDDAVSFAEAAAELKVPPMSAAQVVASTLEAAGNWILGR